ncbi:MAG: acyl carrier protein [Nitrosospira sp.]|jgi:acyl carrier protein|nr:acyl carrier protein [Nitrosospira sp.]MDW7642889.1 acyl carrier protein [Nitrosomonadaceae bacterium]MBI0408210.1 acyl carrier protein [Nitrosospira sp.]MBI0414442.1 acyl carrier protein [Nitrosospira sp.]MBI0416076.1 acyl carrier protein [Nitrosospira sp.]
MQNFEAVRDVLSDVLSLGDRKDFLEKDSILLGNIPELDSMAVVGVIAALEKRFGITVDAGEISAKTFQTLGGLTQFIEQKLAE